MVIIGGDLNGHVEKDVDGCDSFHGSYGLGVKNTEGERVLEMGTALNIVVCNAWFKKRDDRLVTYCSHTCNTHFIKFNE